MRDRATALMVALLFGAVMLEGGIGPAAGGDAAAVQADQAFTRNLSQHDKAAAGALLDAKFEWTNANGQTHSKAVSLEDFDALAADNEGDTDVEARDYGQLALVAGRHHGARFSRIWVKRPAGWRAYVELDTPLPSAAATRPVASPRGAAGDCENPCRTLPFTPVTAADKAVLAEWQKTKMDEWHPDAADWATHITDDFRIINDRSERDREQRVALAKEQQAAGAGAPGDPVLSMRMADFGDAVVMVSRHMPYHGGKPYHNVRVFVHRDGHWPLAWSQQTTIQAAAKPSAPRK